MLHPRPLRRRDFLALGATSLAGAWLLACGGDSGTGDDGGEPPPDNGRHPLRIPATVSPGGLALAAAAGAVDVGGGTSAAWTYNGGFPGPTIVATKGDRATIAFTNNLAQESIIHWHGVLVDEANDGHPKDAVAPGGTKAYDFVVNQRAGFYWYHPHPHGRTGEQVYRGLAGGFIVRDAEETALGLPSGAREVPLVIRDATFDTAGTLQFNATGLAVEPIVNGTRQPYLSVDRALYRFRVLNGSNTRAFRFGLASGAAFTLIGNDAGLLPTASTLTDITLAPAERADIVVDLRDLAKNASLMLRELDRNWDVLELRGTGTTVAGGTLPTGTLSTIAPLQGPATPTRTFSFDGMSAINGLVYEMGRIDFSVPVGTVERWRFTTNAQAPHPVHVHGAHFQVQSRTGGRNQVFPWERGWKDTVLLNDTETVDVLVRFEKKGLYLLHCHQLMHEDLGMMSNFTVV